MVRSGHGYIFPGQSGTGKSTIASLATADETVLSDEMVMVRPRERWPWVYSTPFYGTHKSAQQNTAAPLRAAFLPKKDDEVFLKVTRPAQALAALLASVLFFGQEPAQNRRLMDICTDLVGRVPFYELHFRRDSSFWACLAGLNESEEAKETHP